jgi:hypothetical protein
VLVGLTPIRRTRLARSGTTQVSRNRGAPWSIAAGTMTPPCPPASPGTRTAQRFSESRTTAGPCWGSAFLLLLLALAAAACTDSGNDAGGTADALATEQDCDASSVTWADTSSRSTACVGPWTYTRHRTETSPSPQCGIQGCALRAQCAEWVSQPNHVATTQFTIPATCGFRPGIGYVCEPPMNAATQRCQTFQNQQAYAWDQPADRNVLSSSHQLGILSEHGSRNTRFECVVSIRYQSLITARHATCACETPQYRTCRHTIAGEERVITPSGQSESQVRSAHDASAVGQLTPEQIAPVCSTAENVPATQLELKLTRLLDTLDDRSLVPAAGALHDDIVRRIKITYELIGHAIPAQSPLHGRAMDLYEDHRDVVPTCGLNAAVTGSSCGSETDWRLKLCTRLTSGHVDADLVGRRFDDCLLELDALGDALESGSCPADGPYVEATVETHRRLMESLLVRFAQRLAASTTSPGSQVPAYDTTLIANMLHRIDEWFAHAVHGLGSEAKGHRELALATNKFWQAAQGYVLRNGDLTEWENNSMYAELQRELQVADHTENEQQARAIVESALGVSELRGLALDRAVLTAAYGDVGSSSEAVLSGAPLLRITTDALSPLVERLDALAQFHDVGCAFADCVTWTTPTKLARFWKVLSRLDAASAQPPSLSEVLADSRLGPLNGWAAVFSKIRDRQGRLIDALTEARESDARRDNELVELLHIANTRTKAYAATGLFLPAVGDVLFTGVHANQRERVQEHLNALKVLIQRKRDELDARLVSLVGNLVTVRDREASRAQIEATKERLRVELEALKKREVSLSHLASTGADSEASEFETLMAEWAQISGAIDEAAYLRVESTRRVDATGQHALFKSWTTQDVDTIAIALPATPSMPLTKKIEINAGEVLSIATSGAWAPTCALRDTKMLDQDRAIEALDDPGVDGSTLDQTSIPIGPEGYSISWTGSGYESSDNHGSVVGRITTGQNAQGCGGVTWGYGRAESCSYIDISVTAEAGKSWQAGSEGRTSASFSSGLFLPHTPFEAPAGALVVVEMPRGATHEALVRNVTSSAARTPQSPYRRTQTCTSLPTTSSVRNRTTRSSR